MKRRTPIGNLIASLIAAGILLYIMGNTTSPKLILLPFLICAFAMAGESIAQMLHKDKLAMVFHKCFVAGFLLFWMGVLLVAGYLTFRDKNYSMLILLIPMLFIGILLIKNKLLGKERAKNEATFRFAHVVSAGLVGFALLIGILLLVLGLQRAQWILVFMGVFFLCGGGAFVVGTLAMRGVFDKAKIDVIGLYLGVVFVIVGLGFAVMILQQSKSANLWILIPLLMTAVGILQIVKCIKNKK